MNILKKIGKVIAVTAAIPVLVAAVPVLYGYQLVQQAKGKKGYWNE